MKHAFLLCLVLVVFLSTCNATVFQDGVYISQPDEAAGMDTILGQKNPTTNFGTWINLNFGEQDDEADLGRGLIKFNLPTNVTVTSASLCLYHLYESSSNATVAGVYRMKRAWLEGGATWNTSGSGAWQTAGGFGSADAEQVPIATMTLSANEPVGERCFSLDVNAIQQMVDGSFANNGFLLKTESEMNDLYRFCSSSCTTASQRPKLTITYATGTPTPVIYTATPTATFTPYAPPSNSVNQNPSNTWIIPIMGQSNASGRGENKAQVTDPNVLMFGNDYLYRLAIEPSDIHTNQVDQVSLDTNAGYGFATTLAKIVQDANPNKTVVLVQCAKGGSALREWQKSYADDTLYGSCLKRIRATLGEVVMVAFSQGETDAQNYFDALIWEWQFSQFVHSLRADIGNVPIVYTQLGYYNGSEVFPYWDVVKQRQAMVNIPCVSMVVTDDLPMVFPHYTTAAYDVIGQRMAQAACHG